MPPDSDGRSQTPPDPGPNGSGQSGSRRSKQRRKKSGNGSRSKPPATLDPALKSHYFELPGVDWSMPQFRDVARAVLHHFVKSAQGDATDYLRVAESLNFHLPVITLPTQPANNAGTGPWEIWKFDYREQKLKQTNRKANEASLFALLISQSSEQFMQAAREHSNWPNVSSSTNSMALLRIFQYITATGGVTNMDPIQLQTAAQERYFRFYQSDNMSNAEYYAAFKHHADVARYCGCAMGASLENLMELCLENGMDEPTMENLRAQSEIAIEREMAMMFLTHANRKKYANLVAQATNSRLLSNGAQTFPVTLAAALDLLNSSMPIIASTPHHHQRTADLGTSFFNDGSESQREANGGRGRRGNPNGGRGRGGGRGDRGGRGGRGGRDQDRNSNADAHVNNDEEDFEDTDIDNNNDGVERYSNTTSSANVQDTSLVIDEDVAATEYLFLQSNIHRMPKRHHRNGLPVTWVILDTGSTANIICNKKLLRDIHKVEKGLRVRCNAGVVELTMKGYFGDYPEPVWFNPKGIANILSFNNVNKHYVVVYNNREADEFLVDTGDVTVVFKPNEKGLYHLDLQVVKPTAWTFLETVKGQKEKHTKAAVLRAAQARTIQNIIGRPGDRQYADIVNKNLIRGCPVTATDIKIADNIYGPNLGSLKGKTASRNHGHVQTDVGPVPRHIMELYRKITLAIDILFVNKMPFLVTISRNIKFGTVERLPNRQVPTIKDGVQKVLEVYRSGDSRSHLSWVTQSLIH